jgi:hypothetical protein
MPTLSEAIVDGLFDGAASKPQRDWSNHAPGHHEIELYSGRYLDLVDPDPGVIGLDDVAHGLAFTCRYSGQCGDYYSIAQHSVMCSRYLEVNGRPLLEQLAALHHDDSEAFGNLWPANALHIPTVKEADNWALMVEAWRLLPSKGKLWGGQAHNWDVPGQVGEDDLGLWRGYQSPRTASRSYIRRHNALIRAMQEENS